MPLHRSSWDEHLSDFGQVVASFLMNVSCWGWLHPLISGPSTRLLSAVSCSVVAAVMAVMFIVKCLPPSGQVTRDLKDGSKMTLAFDKPFWSGHTAWKDGAGNAELNWVAHPLVDTCTLKGKYIAKISFHILRFRCCVGPLGVRSRALNLSQYEHSFATDLNFLCVNHLHGHFATVAKVMSPSKTKEVMELATTRLL